MECSDDLRESPHFLLGVASVLLRVKGGSETGLIGSYPSVTYLLNEPIRSFMCVRLVCLVEWNGASFVLSFFGAANSR